jgi:hypothetical protein
MAKRGLLILILAGLGLTLSGCGPCGFFWTDWRLDSCRGEPAPK